ncbi:MAG TPA: HEAT repeat domain-containing protein [Verrucomicrobiae bacterium]|nr:HEAT repeat domain-containing protein [Verrucomicrobiae bacterium]
MKARVICTTIFLALVFLTLRVLFGEPRHHGRTLTSWLRQYNDTSNLQEPQRHNEAHDAVQAIGAKRAIPVLLRLVKTKDDPTSLWLIEKSEKFRWRLVETLELHSQRSMADKFEQIEWRDARGFQLLGVAGFGILGMNAAPAVNELEKSLDDKSYDWVIKQCLVNIGKPSEFVFRRALTNQDPDIREWSMGELAAVTDDVSVYIDRIKNGLKDSSEKVRIAAVDDIGVQENAPELAIPLLITSFQDSSAAVRSHAANALANFGTNALPAFPALSNLVENGEASVASSALNTLIKIAPDEALPILTNSIARGKPPVDDALRSFRDIEPDKALPMILNRFESPDTNAQKKAFALLLRYQTSPQVEDLMKTLATSSDDYFVLSAKKFLTDLYETNHPEKILFPDEPIYDGKRLGEWLKMRNQDADLPAEATNAIVQMGTNVIPALFKRLTYTRPPYCFDNMQINLNAAGGFIALGEQTKPLLPEFEKLMDGTNKNIALVSMFAGYGTGPNVLPLLIKGTTNRFAEVRNEAANILSDDFHKRFPEESKQAVPYIANLLNDPDDDVRRNATNQLKEIAPNATVQFGIK